MRSLGPMLTLIAPTGMNEAARTEWLRVAGDILGPVPADLLAVACRAAVFEVDHPAKVMPFIKREIGAEWKARRAQLDRMIAMLDDSQCQPAAPLPLPDNSPVSMHPAEIAAMPTVLRRMALAQGWLTQSMIDHADAQKRREQAQHV